MLDAHILGDKNLYYREHGQGAHYGLKDLQGLTAQPPPVHLGDNTHERIAKSEERDIAKKIGNEIPLLDKEVVSDAKKGQGDFPIPLDNVGLDGQRVLALNVARAEEIWMIF